MDFFIILSDIEAKGRGKTFFVEQKIMDLFRPNAKRDGKWEEAMTDNLLVFDSQLCTEKMRKE
ncbi:MAG: hypothetical protein IJX97_01150 [Clostridia bacterium]|nr:hypothetical protein [Clostridia bacterium]